MLRGKGRPVPELVDILKLNARAPQAAVKSVTQSAASVVRECDVLVAGGGVGGVAAAMRLAEYGLTVCLTEETDWLGGQMTAQGVSALDENYLVETSGSTRSYQRLRQDIRNHYRTNCNLGPAAAADPHLNPGSCWVAYLAFEPAVGLAAIQNLLAGAIQAGNLETFYRLKPVTAQLEGDRIASVSMVHLDDGSWVEFRARLYLDATELGDLLPLVGAQYTCGAESFAETGEPHAPAETQPDNVQDFVFPFVVEFRPQESHTIAPPEHYDHFKAAGKFSLLGYKMFADTQRREPNGSVVTLLPFWHYRRLIDCQLFVDSSFDRDIALINWESNDLRGMNIIDQPASLVAERLALAKSLSLGFLFWLQTEAPRDDGGSGYPELALRKDLLGTDDGLSKYPYIRESRRIRGLTTVIEQDIAAATAGSARARLFADSVGIGLYPIDIHGHQDVPGAAQAARPFQIPLGALVPKAPANLVACAKNIGTTHITNGSYRLHPVEWAAGEAAGSLAAHCLASGLDPQAVWASTDQRHLLQDDLASRGAPLYWWDDVTTEHPDFAAIQFLSATGIICGESAHLHFHPEQPVSRRNAAEILFAIFCDRRKEAIDGSDLSEEAIAFCLDRKLLQAGADGLFDGDGPLTESELETLSAHALVGNLLEQAAGMDYRSGRQAVVSRAQFAAWSYAVVRARNRRLNSVPDKE